MVIAHIVPWAKVREHTFDNLIYLCQVCHFRFDNGEIDRLSMQQYKANLGVLANRYGDFERRVLELFATSGEGDGDTVDLPGGRDIDLWYLLRDGVVRKVPAPSMQGGGVFIAGQAAREGFQLTEHGKTLVAALREARPVE